MPTVSNQNIIAVLPELARIIRGQANSVNISLHQNFVGNQLNIGLSDNVKVDLYNIDNQVVVSYSKSEGTLTYGTPNSENQGAISLSLSGEQTASLPFGDNNLQGAIRAKIFVTLGSQLIQLPTLKLANIYDAGQEIGDIVASRFTLPGSVYDIKSFVIGDKPSAGEIVLNDQDPSGVTKIRVALTDDKGYRNTYLEQVLLNRIDVDGVKVSLFLTNVNNNSEYSSFEILQWNRIDVLNADSANPI